MEVDMTKSATVELHENLCDYYICIPMQFKTIPLSLDDQLKLDQVKLDNYKYYIQQSQTIAATKGVTDEIVSTKNWPIINICTIFIPKNAQPRVGKKEEINSYRKFLKQIALKKFDFADIFVVNIEFKDILDNIIYS